jgi:hypothetical protein
MFKLQWDTETRCFHAYAVPEAAPGSAACREHADLIRFVPSVILPNAYGVAPQDWPDYYREQAFAALNRDTLS